REIKTMSNGFAGCQARIIKLDDVAKLCPIEARQFVEALAATGKSFDEFCQQSQYDELDQEDEVFGAVVAAWDALAAAFEKVTETEGAGLQIELNYHDSENDGDRYDDVNGGFIEVTDYFAVTPAGKRFESVVQAASWVQY